MPLQTTYTLALSILVIPALLGLIAVGTVVVIALVKSAQSEAESRRRKTARRDPEAARRQKVSQWEEAARRAREDLERRQKRRRKDD